jgi:hypothetical protein
MRAICHVLRNRVMEGWHENWLQAVEMAAGPAWRLETAMNELNLADRRLGTLARDIDGIFYGQAGDEIARMAGRQDDKRGPLLYWQFIDRPLSQHFLENIVRKPEEHRQRGQVGNTMYLYE